jgi:hypothetical protein
VERKDPDMKIRILGVIAEGFRTNPESSGRKQDELNGS